MSTNARRNMVPVSLGVAHAVIDATTVSVIFGAAGLHALGGHDAFMLVVGYDVIAFGSQAAIGLFTDRFRVPRGTALAGVILALLSLVAMPLHAVSAMLLAGAGNALFHVGAGAVALSISPGRAAPAGIFVAPGALGLALGMRVGRLAHFPTWPYYAALVIALVIVATTPKVEDLAPDEPEPARAPREAAPVVQAAVLVAVLLLFSITVRQFVGMAAFPKLKGLAYALPLAAFGGKALGGFLSDRFGFTRTGVGALLLSAPLIAFGSVAPPAVVQVTLVLGMLLFQMTMPVTLAGLQRVFPGRPGFVFGIACLALIGGALPTFSGAVTAHYTKLGFFALILLSAAALWRGLRGLGGDERRPRETPPEAARSAA